jgi:hypothetical protein
MEYNKFYDEELIRKYPNKYGWTQGNICTARILDYDKLQKYVKDDDSSCFMSLYHYDKCEFDDEKYACDKNHYCRFLVEFTRDGITYTSFSSSERTRHYEFCNFYDPSKIKNRLDMQLQAGAIRYMNTLVDEGIISPPNCRIVPLEINFQWDEGPETTSMIIAVPSKQSTEDTITTIKTVHELLCELESEEYPDEPDEIKGYRGENGYGPYGINGRDAETLMSFIRDKYEQTHGKWSYRIIDDVIDLY